MANQSWVALLSDPVANAAGAALLSSTTLTDISPTPKIQIPANYLQIGQALRVFGAGTFSTTGAPTLRFGVYYGGVAGTVLASTGDVTTTSGAANEAWIFEAVIIVRSMGASGTAATFGKATGLNAAANAGTNLATQADAPTGAFATATIDTTAAAFLTLGAKWGTNSASNTVTCQAWTIEGLN